VALVNEQKRMKKEFERFAMTDTLTGLLNRRALLDVLRKDEDRMRRENRPMGVVMADVDRFKDVNDRHGHKAGDRVLRVVASCLLASVRTGDYVGRWGGEEFLLVLPGADIVQCADVAERCRILLEEQEFENEDGQAIRVTASFGAAATESVHRCDIMSLVQQADKAMYWAKGGGRNLVRVYVGSLDQTAGKPPAV
ncbi:MAG TPA: GGDEF domain-containing protein, partial [Planctomycetota bacterium]